MKVFRFMSNFEFHLLYAHCDITNNNHHHNKRTTSTGACFLSCEDFTPAQAFEFLPLSRGYNVCVMFETDRDNLTLAYGTYAQPFPSEYNDYSDTMIITEYCTTCYNDSTFTPLQYAVIDRGSLSEWYVF